MIDYLNICIYIYIYSNIILYKLGTEYQCKFYIDLTHVRPGFIYCRLTCKALLNRKWALHVMMSYSTVCNTISAKKTRIILMKQVCKLYVTLHACKVIVPVSVEEQRTTRCMCACATNQARVNVWICVGVSVFINPISTKQLFVYVMLVLLEARPKMYVCLCMRDQA